MSPWVGPLGVGDLTVDGFFGGVVGLVLGQIQVVEGEEVLAVFVVEGVRIGRDEFAEFGGAKFSLFGFGPGRVETIAAGNFSSLFVGENGGSFVV